jgi:dienelactone hydrolase
VLNTLFSRQARSLFLAFVLFVNIGRAAVDRPSGDPETIPIPSDGLVLHALLWRPEGSGPFPAVFFSHGSGGNSVETELSQARTVGPVFAKHGYAFLIVFRRGSGLSADQGTSAADLLDQAMTTHGQKARNRLQLRLLEGDQLKDALAGLALLRSLPEIDTGRLALAGHSFGATLSLLIAEHDKTIRAVILFSGSAASWEHAPQLRSRLLAAVGHMSAPVFFIQAANDYSIEPTRVLSAAMERAGKPHLSKIYPASGRTAAEGHAFVYREVAAWEADVFRFLDQHMVP